MQRDCPVSGLRRGGVRLLPYQPVPAAALLEKEDGEASIRPQRIGTRAGTRDTVPPSENSPLEWDDPQLASLSVACRVKVRAAA